MMRGLLLTVVYVLSLVAVVWGQPAVTDTHLLSPQVDRISARTARVRFLNVQPTSSYTFTLIQYTNVTGAFNTFDLTTFHTSHTSPSTGNDDHELMIQRVGLVPTTSVILRDLIPQQTYWLRIGYIDTLGQVQGTSTSFLAFNTPALSDNTALSTLLGSGGCGQLTSDGTMHYLTKVDNTNIYQCDVATDVTNVNITIVPQHAYASITSSTPTALRAQNLTLTATSTYADPLVQYTTTLPLGAPATVTNFSWIVTSESGVTQTSYTLSIRRADVAATVSVNGPTSPLVAMVKSPSSSTTFQFRGLTWQGASVGKWKVWSDDLTSFPFSSFNLPLPATPLLTLQVTPANATQPDMACSPVYVALFDQSGNSSPTFTTCISALIDYCSSTPFGTVTKWQQIFNSDLTPKNITYRYPPPPTPWFPAA